jgi:hypothetical protein
MTVTNSSSNNTKNALEKITEDVMNHTPDGWILFKTNETEVKKQGACIRMYMSKRQREALYRLRERFGCTTWKDFANWLLKEYEVSMPK